MTKIGLISDTHGFLDESVFLHFNDCDEVWHAGDFGSGVAGALRNFKPLRGVYGNIDGPAIRGLFPEELVFRCEEVQVLLRHIGGSPPRYNPETRKALQKHRPQLFVTGHSHILKVQYDESQACLFMNPGAAGRQGWHTVRTLLRFSIDGAEIRDCEVVELGRRGG
ncbi:MAG TPA: metallophosphoesterase family protein [Lacibacter sp.]|nr:metallophosphoesterase family protein [Lacibacter sp.]HMO87594.1 metallophosphoesterase family protein [Lacibacter sp.]HMP86037.1 metallophosphoesterase family protein [Lacibacter sp.]